MSETVRETIKRVYDEACNYYQLFEGESDRGAAVLAHALFEHKLSEAIKSRDEAAFSKERNSGSTSASLIPSDSLIERPWMLWLTSIGSVINSPTHANY